MQQPAVRRRRSLREQKVGGPRGGLQIARLAQRRGGLREGVDHQAVPAHEHLVVLAGPHAAVAHGRAASRGWRPAPPVKLGHVAVQKLRALLERLGQVEDVVAFEVALRR